MFVSETDFRQNHCFMIFLRPLGLAWKWKFQEYISLKSKQNSKFGENYIEHLKWRFFKNPCIYVVSKKLLRFFVDILQRIFRSMDEACQFLERLLEMSVQIGNIYYTLHNCLEGKGRHCPVERSLWFDSRLRS